MLLPGVSEVYCYFKALMCAKPFSQPLSLLPKHYSLFSIFTSVLNSSCWTRIKAQQNAPFFYLCARRLPCLHYAKGGRLTPLFWEDWWIIKNKVASSHGPSLWCQRGPTRNTPNAVKRSADVWPPHLDLVDLELPLDAGVLALQQGQPRLDVLVGADQGEVGGRVDVVGAQRRGAPRHAAAAVVLQAPAVAASQQPQLPSAEQRLHLRASAWGHTRWFAGELLNHQLPLNLMYLPRNENSVW